MQEMIDAPANDATKEIDEIRAIRSPDARESSLFYFLGNALAADSFFKKYALRDKNDVVQEFTPDDMHWRLARSFHDIDLRYHKKNKDAHVYSIDEYHDGLKNFARIVPQGSPMAAIGNPYSNISASNCFVIDAEKYGDSISGLLMVIGETAEIMKRRGGVGVDISVYRPYGSGVNNAASSSTGVPSICEAISFFGRYIGQQGRQGALMLTISDRHPDVLRFAKMKSDLSKVTGANVSIKISNDLIAAVENDEDWELRWPIDPSTKPKFQEKVKAKDLWNEIVEQAWKNGEPGLLMWDNYLANLPAECYADVGFKTLTTNPCSEIALSGYDSCRLISLNLCGYVKNAHTPNASFDFDLFEHDVKLSMQMADNLVEIEVDIIDRILNDLEKDKDDIKLPFSVQTNLWRQIKNAALNGRRTGLGTHALYDCLAALGIEFDKSDEMITRIYSTLRDIAYEKSSHLAVDRGAFPVFDWEKEKNNEFIKRLPEHLRSMIKTYGRRNISLLTQAPTGTVSLLSKTTGDHFGTSSGMEPVFNYAYVRKVKITSDKKLDSHSIDQNGDRWHHYPVVHSELLAWADKNLDGGHEIIENAILQNSQQENPRPEYDVISEVIPNLPKQWRITAQNLGIDDRLRIVSKIQSYIDHGISQTCNFPRGTPKDKVEEFYRNACHMGLKGVTVYVDGSRTGVLTNEKKAAKAKAIVRPTDVDCDVYRENGNGMVLIGLVDGKIYEVFAGNREDLPIPAHVKKAKIRKLGSRDYAVVYPKKTTYGRQFEAIIPISESFIKDDGMTVRLLTNLAIRSGVDLEDVVETIFKSADMSAFSRRVARVLSNYITNVKSENCCDAPQMIYEDGCKKCKNCDWSKCA